MKLLCVQVIKDMLSEGIDVSKLQNFAKTNLAKVKAWQDFSTFEFNFQNHRCTVPVLKADDLMKIKNCCFDNIFLIKLSKI